MEKHNGATGAHTTNGIPHGSTSLTPFLTIPQAREAIAFYESVFGVRIVSIVEANGAVMHAELDFGKGKLQVADPNPQYHTVAPPAGEDYCYSLALYCPDVDNVVNRAVDHGATIREPLTTFVSGDRYASMCDPFGVRWTILTRVEDLSEEESARRVNEWAAEQG
ncbi:VOC family protein [Corynebacterium durum]|uniref:VOC family protein n=1 Tax=Corynebacterium durum TaxID=61592 RepID=UPI0028E8E4B3|nr:VOC family protein [Corynebacterium durum]